MSRIFDVDTNLWRTFKSVSETRSITRSSAALCKTPPAISMQIKKLEELLDLQLFVRGDHGFRLTPIGEEVLMTAEKILTMNDNLFRLKDKVNAYELRLGLPDDYSLFFLHDIIRSLNTMEPTIHLNVTCKTSLLLMTDIEHGNLDMAIIATPEGQLVANSEHIRYEALSWIGEEELMQPGQPLPLVHFPEGCICREISVNALRMAGIEARVSFTSDSNFSVFNAINAGAGIGVSERSLIPKKTPVIDSSLLPELPRIEMSTVANYERIPKHTLSQVSAKIKACINASCDQLVSNRQHSEPLMRQSLF